MSAPMDAYFLNHDWRSAARLQFLHFICATRMGYLLHPTIERHLKGLPHQPRILDLGTGSGIWAVEANRLHPEASILGLDIANNQFPPPSTLSDNLTFSTYNFFDPPPADLVGAFDVVHVSFVAAALYRSGPDVVIKHVFQFLRPGGRVQWREMFIDDLPMLDGRTLKSLGDVPGIRYLNDKIRFFHNMAWANDMPKHLQHAAGFEDVSWEVVPTVKSLLRLETNLWMWNLSEGLPGMAESVGIEEAKKEAKDVLRETEKVVLGGGNLVHWPFCVGVGRKSE